MAESARNGRRGAIWARVVALLVLVGVVGHVFYWYWPRRRASVPSSESPVANLVLREAGSEIRVWIPFPHQNLGSLEARLGNLESIEPGPTGLLGRFAAPRAALVRPLSRAACHGTGVGDGPGREGPCGSGSGLPHGGVVIPSGWPPGQQSVDGRWRSDPGWTRDSGRMAGRSLDRQDRGRRARSDERSGRL